MKIPLYSIIYLGILLYIHELNDSPVLGRTVRPLPASFQASSPQWSVDGGNNYRHNRIQYVPPSQPVERGRILTLPVFNDASTSIALNSHSVPLISNDQRIYWLDKHCNLLSILLPNQTNREWHIIANFSHTAAPFPEYVPCTQMVYDMNRSVLHYGNRYSATLNAIDVQTIIPQHTSFSPVQLPTEQTFQLLTHHSLYNAVNNVWYPLRYEYGVLRFDSRNGEYARILFPTTGSLPPLLGGSTGLPSFTPGNEDGGGVAFAVYPPPDDGNAYSSSTPSLIAVNSSGSIVWSVDSATIPYTTYARDDPVTIEIPTEEGTMASCIILLQQSTIDGSTVNPARLYGINATTGTTCLTFDPSGYPLPIPYGTEIYIVGTPAYLPASSTHPSPPLLYYVAGHTLVQTILRPNGIEFNASSASLGSIDSHICTTAPIIFQDGWGTGKDIVTVGTGDGRVLVFDAYDIAKGPVYIYDIPTPSNFRSAPRIVGPFMAATNDGTLILIVHETSPQSPSGSVSDDYSAIALVAIVPVIVPPEHIIPPPPPSSKGMGLRTAFLVLLIGTAFGLAGYGIVKFYRRRRQRQLDLERSWYTSMAAFDEPAARFNEL